MERQAPFLKSVLQEANQHKRQELLRMANADQINAISELVMNTLRGTVPRSRHTITLLVQAWLTQFVKTAQGVKQSASPGGPSRPGRKPLVPPKPSFTPSAKKKLKFTPEVSSAELAQELPFSEEPGTGPWDTPSERVDSIKNSI